MASRFPHTMPFDEILIQLQSKAGSLRNVDATIVRDLHGRSSLSLHAPFPQPAAVASQTEYMHQEPNRRCQVKQVQPNGPPEILPENGCNRKGNAQANGSAPWP